MEPEVENHHIFNSTTVGPGLRGSGTSPPFGVEPFIDINQTLFVYENTDGSGPGVHPAMILHHLFGHPYLYPL